MFLCFVAALVLTAAPTPAVGLYQPPWNWPLNGRPAVIRPFIAPPQPWSSGHRGVDLAASPGDEVLSPGAGRVAFVGWVVDRPVITVDHGAGVLSSFEPVSSGLATGESVGKGTSLGSVSQGGHCPGTCLHWGVRVNGVYVDPLGYVLDRRPSVLLPLPPR